MAVIQAGSGFIRTADFPGFPWVDAVTDCGAVGNGIADDTAAIQCAINSAARGRRGVYLPKGTYRITDTLRMTTSDMRFWGDGSGHRHNSVVQENVEANTRILWDGVANGEMFYWGAVAGGVHLGGGDFRGVMLDGNNKATTGLRVRSVIESYLEIMVHNFADGTALGNQAAVYFDSWQLTVELLDWADNQHWKGIWIETGRDNRGVGVWFDGSSTSDTSVDHNVHVKGFYGIGANAHGVVIGNTDNNTFSTIEMFDQSVGTSGARGLIFKASNSGLCARKNVIKRCSPGLGTVYFEGNEKGTSASQFNMIEWYDTQGLPFPVQPATYGTAAHTNRVWFDSEHWTRPISVVLGASVVTASAAFVSAIGVRDDLQFYARAGLLYKFQFSGTYEVANTTTGLSLGFDSPGGPCTALVQIASAGPATLANEWITANDTGTGTATTDVANVARFWRMDGQYACTTSGLVTVRFKRNGTNANVTIHAGSGGTVSSVPT